MMGAEDDDRGQSRAVATKRTLVQYMLRMLPDTRVHTVQIRDYSSHRTRGYRIVTSKDYDAVPILSQVSRNLAASAKTIRINSYCPIANCEQVQVRVQKLIVLVRVPSTVPYRAARESPEVSATPRRTYRIGISEVLKSW